MKGPLYLLLLLTPTKQTHLTVSSPPPHFIQLLLCHHLSSSPLHPHHSSYLSNSPSPHPPPPPLHQSISLCSPSPHLSLLAASPSFFPSQPPSPSPQLHSVLYCTATAWVSPPEVSSCIRLPEAGRFVPVAQLKNILEENKDMEAMVTHMSVLPCSIKTPSIHREVHVCLFKTIRANVQLNLCNFNINTMSSFRFRTGIFVAH